MRVLNIGSDSSIFVENSSARARMREYANAIGELHILSSAKDNAKEEKDGNLFLHPIFASKLFRVPAFAKKAHELILEKNIEVVSAQDPFEHGLAALKAIEVTNARLHIQVHTDFLSPWFIRSGNWRSPRVRMPLLNRYRRKIADRVLPAAHGIRTVSERVKNSIIDRYGSKISEPSVIPVFVNPIVPDVAQLPGHHFNFSLIYVGRLEPEKRIQDILAALKIISVRYPMVGLFVVGEGRELARLKRMTNSLGLASRVIFLGNRSDAWGLMRSANALIQASAYEGYGRTLIEAALARVPIITTDVGIVGEVFKGYEDVLSIPVADPTALSFSIIGLIEDTAVRHELPIHAEMSARAHLTSYGNIPSLIVADLRRTIKAIP